MCLSPIRSLGHLASWLSVPLCPASVPVSHLCGACGLKLCACLHWCSVCRLGSPETPGPEMWTLIVRSIACSVPCASAAQMTGCPGVREHSLLSSHTQAMVVSIPEWLGQPQAPWAFRAQPVLTAAGQWLTTWPSWGSRLVAGSGTAGFCGD